MTPSQPLPPAGFFRRLAALFYDALIVIAIEMIAGGIVIAILEALFAAGLITYGNYVDVSDLLTNHPLWSPLYSLYLVLTGCYFFIFFWTRAGQTLGMRAWKLRIQNEDGSAIRWTQAVLRLAVAGFGLANIMALVDPKKRGLHDLVAKTQVVVLPKAN